VKEILVSSSSAPLSTPEGPDSVSGAPNLPAGFTDRFTSRYIDTGELRQHAVIGGDAPPLLLVHGWPETWCAWRLLMPALARDFEVIAVDQRGIGLTDKPEEGYDSATLAGDLVALMDALGHQRFAVVGHDTGYIISNGLAADHPHRLDRVALAETPGPRWRVRPRPCSSPSRSTTSSGTSLQPGRRGARAAGQGTGGHLLRLRVRYPDREREEAAPTTLVDYYVRILSDPDALRGCFGLYRAWDTSAAQNEQRATRPLTMPVLAIGGAASWDERVGSVAANDVRTVVVPGTGHWVAETAPEEMLVALAPFLAPFLAPYRS
jgi:pimeloyl-ACP methyl ester carboxylesterase